MQSPGAGVPAPLPWEQEVQRLVALAGAQEANLRELVRANDSVFLDPARVGGDVCAPLPQQLGFFLRGQQHDDGGDKEEQRRRSAALRVVILFVMFIMLCDDDTRTIMRHVYTKFC